MCDNKAKGNLFQHLPIYRNDRKWHVIIDIPACITH